MDDLIFAARDVSFRYPRADTDAVHAVSLGVERGELIALAGPNGSGKTTLLRLLLGVLIPSGGVVETFGRAAHTWDRRALARRVGVVVQREEPVFPLRVREAVALGRYPHLRPLAPLGPKDREAVDAALSRADATALADRWIGTLSGGEWQRVRVARALAQEPEVLVLDEATAGLDIRHEMEVLELVADLVRERGLTGVLVTHNVNLAARFVDRLAILDRGRAAAVGSPAKVLTRDVLERVFRWPVEIVPWHGVPQVVALRAAEAAEAADPAGWQSGRVVGGAGEAEASGNGDPE
jgi:iron complex transport system ATP-binding protein